MGEKMPTVVLLGAQRGDEVEGKPTDPLVFLGGIQYQLPCY